jgi:Sigma-70, region 4
VTDQPLAAAPTPDEPVNSGAGPGDAESRAGSPWTAEEDERLVDGLRSGVTVGVLAERHERTPGAIGARLVRMIPAGENVPREAAADWLRERLQSPDYPWQEILECRTAARRNARAAQATRVDRARLTALGSNRADHEPEYVLGVWQDTVGFTLAEQRQAVFVERAEVAELRHYPDQVLTGGARDVYDRDGELRLDRWAVQCARAALGIPALDWSRVSAAGEIAAAVRRIVNAAVAGLSSERRQLIMAQRLGLDGEPQTFQSIGEALGISRERVRQVQDQALRALGRRYGNEPAQRLLAGIRADATAAGVSPARVLLTLAQLGVPGGDVRLAVTALAILTGDNRDDAQRLATEAVALPADPDSVVPDRDVDETPEADPPADPADQDRLAAGDEAGR